MLAAAAAPAALLALAPTPARTPGSRPLARAPAAPSSRADNPWNQRVDGLPVAGDSDRVIAAIGAGGSLHPTFGPGRYQGEPVGIPFTTVPRRQRRVRVRFTYRDESNRVRYPIPRGVPVEGGPRSRGRPPRDHRRPRPLPALRALRAVPAAAREPHVARRLGRGVEPALQPAASARLDSRRTRRDCPSCPGWPATRRCGAGSIDHALRLTVHATRPAFVYPARHYASESRAPDLPPMGLRLRLKAGVDISGFPRQSRIVLTALKRYGMLVADNGGDWYVTGAPSSGWDDADLHELLRIHGRDFEVVDTSSLPRPSP